MVFGRIINDKYRINDNKYGLQYIVGVDANDRESYFKILNNKQEVEIANYKSQVGVQGFIFSFLYNKLHIPIDGLHLICSILLAVILTVICCLLKEKYGKLFAGIFYIVFLMSPWIVNFAKNLYWIEFTWFLPLMLALLLDKTNNKKIILPLIFLSILFKCLCGYEYLSTILLAMIGFYLVDFVMEKEKRKKIFITMLHVGIISVLAFLTAICIHSLMRGNGNIIEGIQVIFKEDVMRRTVSNDSSLFSDNLVKESIEASYGKVIKKYLDFSTDVIYGIDGKMFIIIALSAFAISMYSVIENKDNSRDISMYFIFMLCTLSWFILGKAHSYIHTHMNFVLWYFGYIQVCFYIIIKFIITKIKECEGEKL